MTASTTLRAAAVLSVLALTLGTVPAGGCAGPAPGRDPSARRRLPVADERWARTVAGGPSGLAADRAGAVTVSGRGGVTSFDAAAGTRLWEADVGGPPTPFVDPAVDHALVLVAASERVVALDRATGAVRWEAPLDAGSSGNAVHVATAVALAHHGGGPLALVGTDRGVLSARETARGAERWRSAAIGALEARPAVDGEAGLVVASWSGGARTTLRALDLRTGAPRWSGAWMRSPVRR
jgi:outer membrane protein assembly factor BamB